MHVDAKCRNRLLGAFALALANSASLAQQVAEGSAPASFAASSPAAGHARAAPARSNSAFERGVAAYDSGRYDEAMALWLPIASAGNAAAQFNVANLFENGQGIDKDDRAASRWYLAAAQHGDAEAQIRIASRYESGVGIGRDLGRAAAWYRGAAINPKANAALRTTAQQAIRRLDETLKPADRPSEEIIPFEGGRFVIESGGSGHCVIALQGFIGHEADYVFDEVLKRSERLGCARPLTLMLESPGGGLIDGLALGRQVHEEGMQTIARYACASACSIVFLGGAERILSGSRAAIGFHQVVRLRGNQKIEDGDCVTHRASSSASELQAYLRHVVHRTADWIYNIVMETSCKSMTWVTGRRALELGVATRLDAPDRDLFGPRKDRVASDR